MTLQLKGKTAIVTGAAADLRGSDLVRQAYLGAGARAPAVPSSTAAASPL